METIGALIKLITALSIIGGLLALAGSIASCVGLCQQNDQVRRDKSLIQNIYVYEKTKNAKKFQKSTYCHTLK